MILTLELLAICFFIIQCFSAVFSIVTSLRDETLRKAIGFEREQFATHLKQMENKHEKDIDEWAERFKILRDDFQRLRDGALLKNTSEKEIEIN